MHFHSGAFVVMSIDNLFSGAIGCDCRGRRNRGCSFGEAASRGKGAFAPDSLMHLASLMRFCFLFAQADEAAGVSAAVDGVDVVVTKKRS